MHQNPHPEHNASSLWGINLAIGYLLALAALLFLGTLVVGLGVFTGASTFGGGLVGGTTALALCLLVGVLQSGIFFSFAMALMGIKSEVMQLRKLNKIADGSHARLAAMDQRLTEIAERIPNLSSGSQPSVVASPAVAAIQQPADMSQLLSAMIELRDTLLMSDPEKAALLKRRLEQKRRGLLDKLHHHLRHEEWKAAETVIQDFNLLFPDDPQSKNMNDELAFARKRKVDRDLSDAQDRIRGWIGSSRWDLVEPQIAQLELQYPDDKAVVAYVDQIRGEMHSWHQEELQNLIGQLKDASDHRQWRRASLIAQQLLEKYPDDKLVEKLRSELPTLRKNADLQEVKDLEAQFKELLQRRRYDEAFPIAQKVIDEHPETAVANELVKMLPKLQELMKQDKLRRKAELGDAG
jgi:hypothetical protein